MIFFLLGRAYYFHIIIFLLNEFSWIWIWEVSNIKCLKIIHYIYICRYSLKLYYHKRDVQLIFFIHDSRWYWYHIITYINFIVQCQIRTFIVHKNITFPYIEKIIVHVSLFMLQQFSFSLNRKGVQWVIFKAAINIFLVETECFLHWRCCHRKIWFNYDR